MSGLRIRVNWDLGFKIWELFAQGPLTASSQLNNQLMLFDEQNLAGISDVVYCHIIKSQEDRHAASNSLESDVNAYIFQQWQSEAQRI